MVCYDDEEMTQVSCQFSLTKTSLENLPNDKNLPRPFPSICPHIKVDLPRLTWCVLLNLHTLNCILVERR